MKKCFSSLDAKEIVVSGDGPWPSGEEEERSCSMPQLLQLSVDANGEVEDAPFDLEGQLSEDFFPSQLKVEAEISMNIQDSTPRRSSMQGMSLPTPSICCDPENNEREDEGDTMGNTEGGHVSGTHGKISSLCFSSGSCMGTTSPTSVELCRSPDPSGGAEEKPSDSDHEEGYPFSRWAPPLPRVASGRAAHHSERYKQFIQAYFRIGEPEAAKETRHIRSTCLNSVKNESKKGSSTFKPKTHLAPTVTTSDLPRHTVVAVEGDFVFTRLIDRAEALAAARQFAAEGQLSGKRLVLRGTGVYPPPNAAVRASEMLSVLDKKHRRCGSLTPNASCVALHYSPGPPVDLTQRKRQRDAEVPVEHRDISPQASLMAVLTTSRVERNEEIIVSLASYFRCLDEQTWYECRYGRRCQVSSNAWGGITRGLNEQNPLYGPSLTNGVKQFCMWPKNLNYYHGVGHWHRSSMAQAGFPFTLLDLKKSPEIGAGELGVYAAALVPYGTSFLYGGSVATTEQVQQSLNVHTDPSTHRKEKKKTSEMVEDISDDTYALGLDDNLMCFGQSVSRYINHRYNLSPYGNVELCSINFSMLSYPYTISKDKSQSNSDSARDAGKKLSARSTPLSRAGASQCDKGYMVTIPFFIATTDIEPGLPLLAWTYGEEYDAKLERAAVADGALVPFMDAEVLNHRLSAKVPRRRLQRYKGDYRYALRVGDIVWRRRPLRTVESFQTTRCGLTVCTRGSPLAEPEEDLFVIVEVQEHGTEYALIESLSRDHSLSSAEWNELLEKEQLSVYDDSPTLLRCKREMTETPVTQLFALFRTCHRKDRGAAVSLAVSTTSSMALLLADSDYYEVTETNPLPPNLESQNSRTLIVPLTSLRENTSLVRFSSRKSCVPPLLHPSVWPVFKDVAVRCLVSEELIYQCSMSLANSTPPYRPWYCHRPHGTMIRCDLTDGYSCYTHLRETDCDCTPPASPAIPLNPSMMTIPAEVVVMPQDGTTMDLGRGPLFPVLFAIDT